MTPSSPTTWRCGWTAGIAEMSCIAGLGANVRSLVRKARDAADSGRPIVAIDGCILACTMDTLPLRGIEPTEHIQLAQAGVRKRYHMDFEPEQAEEVFQAVCDRLMSITG